MPAQFKSQTTLIASLKKYLPKNIFPSAVKERPVVEAYDIWADSYDHQPGNLMLDLDQLLLSQLIVSADVNGKDVADIGCGTGRHWPFILHQDPASLTGFDVSPGMLHKLKEKFPAAKAHTIINNRFSEIPDDSYDVILSTLTIAHIENIEEALQSWSRLLKPTGDIVITDFHPNVLASGGQRTFKHHNGHIAVRNFVHPVDALKKILLKCNFVVAADVEKRVDESVKHYYQQQNALHVYDKFKGFPIIYGIHFRRG